MKLAYPLRPLNYTKVDTVFCDKYYQTKYEAFHTGVDLNGKGGGETDYGYAVVSPYAGIVTDVKVGKSKWGLIVRVWHPALNIFSRSAHLLDTVQTSVVQEGQEVIKGQIIGHLGNAYGAWGSHLHFDLMRDIKGIPFDHWVQGLSAENFKEVNRVYLDPIQVFSKFGVE